MKKLIISALICAFCTSAAIAQDSARVRPSKVTFNNMLAMVTLDAQLVNRSFPVSFLPLYISDLSFDDFDREVIIERINYTNKLGEMVRDSDSYSKSIVLRYDSAEDEYRIMYGSDEAGDALAVKPSNQKRINK